MLRYSHLWALGAFIITLMLLGGCGGGTNSQLRPAENANSADFSIGSPETVLAHNTDPRQTSAAVIYHKGAEFLTDHQNVEVDGTAAHFAPFYSGSQAWFNSASYAIYRFNISGYSGAKSLGLTWGQAAPTAGNTWIGLSLWTHDHWVWFPAPEDWSLEIPAADFYTYSKQGTGEFLVALVVLGTDEVNLNELYLGATSPVHTISGHIQTSTGTGMPGVTVTFDGGLSSVTTDGAGYFEKTGVYDGTYLTTPSKTGITFTPAYRNAVVSGADVTTIDFQSSTAQGGWWMFGNDPLHRRQSTNNGPQDDTVRWQFATGGPVTSSPGTASDGTIYVGSQDGKLHAINPGGTSRWEFTTGAAVWSSPAVGVDGTIYVGSLDNKLYAINPGGTKKWDFPTGDDLYSSPTIGPDNTIYIGGYDDMLYAVNPDGTQKWSFTTGGNIASSPAVAEDSTVYVGCFDNYLYAVNADGTLKWKYETGGNISFSSPSIGLDGTIYIGSLSGTFYAVNPDGTAKWNYPTGGNIWGGSAVDSSGRVYFGSWDNSLYCLNTDGSLSWKYTVSGPVWSSPAIGADGTVYFGSANDYVFALDGTGALKWSLNTGGDVLSSPAISNDGAIYVGNENGTVWACGLGGATYTVSGSVKNQASVGILGVNLAFSGGLNNTTTDDSGNWQVGSVPNGVYTVSPTKAGYVFAPASYDFTVAGADVVVSTITGDPNTASGYVKNSGGTGVAGVTLTFTGGIPAVVTNSSGYWIASGIPNGMYTVTPSKNGYTFAPLSQNFSINDSDASLANFVGDGSGAINITAVTTDKTTHLQDGTETAANLNVTTDNDPADTYSWTGPGVFSDASIANPTWHPNGSTPLGKATLTITVTAGAGSDVETIDMYVTTEGIKGSWVDRDGGTRQIGDPAGSGHVPDFDMSTLQYLKPLSQGGDITTYNGTFHQWIAGKVVLFDRWELWCGPCKAEYPTLDNYAETYGPYGYLFTANGDDASPYGINDIKGWFQSNGIDYCNHFHGNIVSQWMTLGADNYIPFNILIDRDGYVRKVGGAATGADWQTCIENLLGY